MKRFREFINENVYKDEFLRLYNLAPQTLKDEVDKTKEIEQSNYWHPEGVTYIHIRLVTNRLANCYNDVNLNLAGFFHDLGKSYTTEFNEDKQDWTAKGHEDESVKILDNYVNWVKKQGGDIDIVRYVVSNHMRYKFLEEMRLQEQIKFLNNPYFSYVEKFNTADYGGTELYCKSIPENTELVNKINDYYKTEEENKEIASKFNGRIVMDKYPELKGEKLGKILNGFKSNFEDYRKYILSTPKNRILDDFDNYVKRYE